MADNSTLNEREREIFESIRTDLESQKVGQRSRLAAFGSAGAWLLVFALGLLVLVGAVAAGGVVSLVLGVAAFALMMFSGLRVWNSHDGK